MWFLQITVPKALVALMSAVKKETVPKPGDDRYVVNCFEQSIPIPSYLLAIVVGALKSRWLSNLSKRDLSHFTCVACILCYVWYMFNCILTTKSITLLCRDIGPKSKVWSEESTLDAAAHEFAQVIVCYIHSSYPQGIFFLGGGGVENSSCRPNMTFSLRYVSSKLPTSIINCANCVTYQGDAFVLHQPIIFTSKGSLGLCKCCGFFRLSRCCQRPPSWWASTCGECTICSFYHPHSRMGAWRIPALHLSHQRYWYEPRSFDVYYVIILKIFLHMYSFAPGLYK